MSEEELNQKLSTDELKDVAGGISLPTQPTANKATGEHIDKLVQIESFSKKGKKGKKGPEDTNYLTITMEE